MKEHASEFNKYSHLSNKDLKYRSTDPKNALEYVKHTVFGKDQSEKRFDAKADNYFKARKNHQSFGKGHLGMTTAAGTAPPPAHVKLTNPGGLMWTGMITIGQSAMQDISVVFDTGSDWLVIPSINCTTCAGSKYSGNGIDDTNTGVISERHYGSASLKGIEAKDYVCIGNANYASMCVQEFKYFLISEQVGLVPPIDGILGLSRNIKSAMGGKSMVDVGPLLVESLVRDGIINEPMFSFYMNYHGVNRLDFGNGYELYNQGVYQYDFQQWNTNVTLLDDFFWSQHLDASAYGNITNGFAFSEGPKYAIFDTGSSHIFIPNNYYMSIINQIAHVSGDPEIAIEDGIAVADCKAKWAPIYFQFQGYWHQVNPEDYLVDISENGDQSLCHIAIVSNDFDFFLFGIPAFRGFQSVHDMISGSISFCPTDDANKEAKLNGPLPTQFLVAEEASEIHFILLILIVFIVIGVAGGIGIDAVLRDEGYTENDGIYWAWQCGWGWCCCLCGLATWAIIAVIFISTLPVNEEYTASDASAESGSFDKADEQGHYQDPQQSGYSDGYHNDTAPVYPGYDDSNGYNTTTYDDYYMDDTMHYNNDSGAPTYNDSDYYNDTYNNDTYNNDTMYEPHFAGDGSTNMLAKKFNSKTNQWLRLMVFSYVIVCAYVFKYAVVSQAKASAKRRSAFRDFEKKKTTTDSEHLIVELESNDMK